MSQISSENLSKVLELRKKNGLEATEAAANADLEASKASWTEKDTPRYRRAGESPIYISGKYLTKTGVCPATGERETGHQAKSPKEQSARTISEEVFYKILHHKGFKISITKDLITQEIRTDIPTNLKNLNLKFAEIPKNAEAGVYVTQTTPQIQVSMNLDTFLEMAGLRP